MTTVRRSVKDLKHNDELSLMIIDKTDLGYKAILIDIFDPANDEAVTGVIYHNEVFQDLKPNQIIKGYLNKIREYGKIDLALAKTGHLAAEEIGPKILKLIQDNNGFFDINQKTDPERIYQLFGVSKKKYKIVLGDLYKRRLILIEENGIRLVGLRG